MPESPPKILNVINAEIERRRVNQTELAEKTGIAQSQLSPYLSGRVQLPVKKLDLILEALDLNPRNLLTRPKDPTEEEFVEAFIRRSKIDPVRKEALCAVLRADADQWATILPSLETVFPGLPLATDKRKRPG